MEQHPSASFLFETAQMSQDNSGGGCVAVATNIPGTTALRDTKLEGSGPVHQTTREEFIAFAGFLETAGF